MNLSVKIEGLDKLKRLLDPRKVNRALVSTANRVANSTVSQASDIIRNEKGWRIKKADLDPRLTLKKATLVQSWAVLSPRKGKDSIALTYFGAKEVKQSSVGVMIRQRDKQGNIKIKKQKRSRLTGGVSVQVLRGGQVAHFPHGFISRMPSGHVGVFRSVKEDGKWKIKEIRTVSVLTLFKGIRLALISYAKERWRKEFAAQLKYYFRVKE